MSLYKFIFCWLKYKWIFILKKNLWIDSSFNHLFAAGSTKSKQRETIELFTKGDFKVIVATTIAEEGLDIEECNLVVKYDYAGNLISQIQAKGTVFH